MTSPQSPISQLYDEFCQHTESFEDLKEWYLNGGLKAFKKKYDQIPRAVERKIFNQMLYVPKSIDKEFGWLTINPSDKLPVTDLINRSHDFFQHHDQWFTGVVYSFEQRSEKPGEYSGFHVHALFKRNVDTPAYKLSDYLKRPWSDCCNVSNSHCFNLMWINEEEAKKKLKYLLGDKKSEKMLKVANDKNFRLEYNLDDSYNFGCTPLLLGATPTSVSDVSPAGGHPPLKLPYLGNLISEL